MEGGHNSKNEQNPKKTPRQHPNLNKEHIFRKRKPQKPERANNVLYVNTKSPIKVILDRCNQLITNGEKELIIYCLGAAIQRGILTALKVCEQHVNYNIHTSTFTTELIDDLEPTADDVDYTIQHELVRWLGLTVFEIWINLISFFMFTITIAVKYNPDIDVASNNWWTIFFPLFAGDALNGYFCVIIFIRMLSEMTLRTSLLRISWSGTFLLMTFLFKFLLCKKLLNDLGLDYSEVFAPLYILLQLIAVRACQQS